MMRICPDMNVREVYQGAEIDKPGDYINESSLQSEVFRPQAVCSYESRSAVLILKSTGFLIEILQTKKQRNPYLCSYKNRHKPHKNHA